MLANVFTRRHRENASIALPKDAIWTNEQIGGIVKGKRAKSLTTTLV
ncbi:MAG: hypothetical protein PHZ02_04655 [Desulfocapsaceae bacterium]|nr:hypothetical protein [Desulfocapsaceae bacterium]